MKTQMEILEIAMRQCEEDTGRDGVCINCGEESHECEPDARGYHCEACGQDKVYGCQEVIMMGF